MSEKGRAKKTVVCPTVKQNRFAFSVLIFNFEPKHQHETKRKVLICGSAKGAVAFGGGGGPLKTSVF
jgi:hypothetical protein